MHFVETSAIAPDLTCLEINLKYTFGRFKENSISHDKTLLKLNMENKKENQSSIKGWLYLNTLVNYSFRLINLFSINKFSDAMGPEHMKRNRSYLD